MGAWGYGLFQSDHDLDIVCDLDVESGVRKLQDDYEQKQEAEKSDSSEPTSESEEAFTYFSLYCHGSKEQEAIRKHLDSGVLTDLLIKKEAAMLSLGPNEHPFTDPGYTFVILLACAMGLGCRIPESSLTSLRKVYTCVGLMPDAIQQIHAALDGPNRFTSGSPYDLSSPGLIETMEQRMEESDSQASGRKVMGMNVLGPGGMFDVAPKGSKEGLKQLKVAFAKGDHLTDVCGNCGAKEGKDGAALTRCAKCKKRKFCSKACQTAQWNKMHKQVCKAADGGEDAKAD